MKRIEAFFKQLLLFVLLRFKRSRHSADQMMFNENSVILFIRLNRIGDALVTTPLLKIVKEALNCRIEILADQKNHFIFQNNPSVNVVHIFQKGISGFRNIIKLINNKNYDAIVDLHDDVSTTVSFILALSKCRNVFGFSKGNDQVYSKTIPRPDPQETHVVDRILSLAAFFNINTRQNTNIVYCIKDSVKVKIEKLINNRFPIRKFMLGINISAGSAARYWGTQRFRQLHIYLSKYEITPLFLCSTRDIRLALEITGNKENIFYSPDFEEFSAMITQMDMLFTPDTSVVHIASAYNIPVFGLYVKFNTSDMIWAPYKSDFQCIITEEPTLTNVSFDKVLNKFIPFLEKYIKKDENTRV